ncbi:MAG: nitroreductase [Pseudomonadales bacterium]|nr:nitroreductase [Pseudomonadales bacterium]
MQVSDAVAQRKSVRAFSDKPVSSELIKTLLTKSARAPSGGNLQPWRLYVINGDSMNRFQEHLNTPTKGTPESPAYDIYPQSLSEPYRSSRYKVGEDMYALLNIPREDKAGRFKQLKENYKFFGAPAAFFCFVDRQMGPPQWSDLGMFLQTFMLLAQANSLSTCAQEVWATKPRTVSDFVGAPDELMLFCGMAIGYENTDAAINSLVSDRADLDQFATFL